MNIAITCQPLPCYNWMSFVCWRSISLFLPDSNIFLVLKRNNQGPFPWVLSAKVRVLWNVQAETLYKGDPLLVVDAGVLMLRNIELSGSIRSPCGRVWFSGGEEEVDWLCSDASSEEIRPFCGYGVRCGKFVTEEWIHKGMCPFGHRFEAELMTCNERRILDFWRQAYRSFATLSRR